MKTWKERGRRGLFALCAFALALALWLPCMHLVFRPTSENSLQKTGIAPMARALAKRHVDFWMRNKSSLEHQRMRHSNAEWDLMGRSFFVWSLANMVLREPAQKERYLRVMDRVIQDTLRLERKHGMAYFSMKYIHGGPFVLRPSRSLFLDGEIALMLAVRRLVREHEGYQQEMKKRVKIMLQRMKQSPVLSAESYPNESWMFCNTVALVALKASDHLDGTDHSAFFRRWVQVAKAKLVEPKTGLLISSYTFSGKMKDGPEGTTIWMSAHNLKFIDEAFARSQYQRAKALLARTTLGFGYAVEWGEAHKGSVDIDSGPIIPLFEVSPGSSGLAFVGAGAFGDTDYLRALLTTVSFAGFPQRKDGDLRFLASNQVGDAVMLYALVQGPVWERWGPQPKRTSKPTSAPTSPKG